MSTRKKYICWNKERYKQSYGDIDVWICVDFFTVCCSFCLEICLKDDIFSTHWSKCIQYIEVCDRDASIYVQTKISEILTLHVLIGCHVM